MEQYWESFYPNRRAKWRRDLPAVDLGLGLGYCFGRRDVFAREWDEQTGAQTGADLRSEIVTTFR